MARRSVFAGMMAEGLRLTEAREAKEKAAKAASKPASEPEDDGPASGTCPACGGTGESLGTLGTVPYFRCRACGCTFSED